MSIDPNPTPAPSVEDALWRSWLLAHKSNDREEREHKFGFFQGAKAALARPSPSVERREEVARIIDPHAFTLTMFTAPRSAALAKSDAILALIAQPATLGEGHATLIRCVQTMRHALTFITSREKMHPDGVKLYRIDLMCLESLAEDLAQHATGAVDGEIK